MKTGISIDVLYLVKLLSLREVSSKDLRVFLILFTYIAGFDRSQRIKYSELRRFSRLSDQSNLKRSLRRLERAGVITVIPVGDSADIVVNADF